MYDLPDKIVEINASPTLEAGGTMPLMEAELKIEHPPIKKKKNQ